MSNCQGGWGEREGIYNIFWYHPSSKAFNNDPLRIYICILTFMEKSHSYFIYHHSFMIYVWYLGEESPLWNSNNKKWGQKLKTPPNGLMLVCSRKYLPKLLKWIFSFPHWRSGQYEACGILQHYDPKQVRIFGKIGNERDWVQRNTT